MWNAWKKEQTAWDPLITRRNPLLWKEVQLSELLFNKDVMISAIFPLPSCVTAHCVDLFSDTYKSIWCKYCVKSSFDIFSAIWWCVCLWSLYWLLVSALVLWWCDVLPEGLLKSRTLAAGCSRSGLLDDRLPGMGIMATLCRHCLVPTILSSWDWDKPLSLRTQRKMDYIQHKH